jgi:hypothetical protein
MAAVFPDQWFGGDHDTRARTPRTRGAGCLPAGVPREHRFCQNGSRRDRMTHAEPERGKGGTHEGSPCSGNQPHRHSRRNRLPGVPQRRGPRLVAASSPLRPVRPHRMLRFITLTACQCPRAHGRPSRHKVLRTWGGLVLRAHHEKVLPRPAASGSTVQTAGAAGTCTGRQGARRLAGALTPVTVIRNQPLHAGMQRRMLARLYGWRQ